MADSKRNDLVVRSSSEIVGTERRTPRVIEQMVRDVLVRASSQAVSSPRFYIGDTALREPDYRQILRWAEAIQQTPEALLATLKVCEAVPEEWEGWPAVALVLADGAMVSLAWDHRELPRLPDVWEPGLLIQKLAINGKVVNDDDPFTLRPNLPNLRTLICPRTGLELLDLDLVPGLTVLDFSYNQLTELDLTPVPGLTTLNCKHNRLTKLDLSPVPGLTVLDCYWNQLTELDLTPVLGLTELECECNQLTKLDLTPVLGLTVLYCDENVRILNPPQDLEINSDEYI
jgi:hypothetical protein